MRPYRGSLWCCALAALAMANGSAHAAWNNVFQVCCHSCRSSNYVAVPAPAVAAYAPAPCGSCQQCTTRYIQRCYYQPVTTYRQSCYMEPVTTYRTSYYYEPCTSYRYSCYYNPCTCSYQQVASPVTTYRLRSQSCPVTNYLQRCCLQPVTSYQQMTYYVPQTTCCTTTIGAPVAAPPCGAPAAPPCAASVAPAGPPVAAPSVPPGVQGAPMVPAPGVSGGPIGAAPGVAGGPAGAPPGVAGGPTGAPPGVSGQGIYPPPPGVQGGAEPQPPVQAGETSNSYRVPYMPPSGGSSYRQPRLQGPVPAQPSAPAPAPRVRLDRITSAPRHNTEGQVVRGDRQPQAGIKVIFVGADAQGGRQTLTSDGAGRFQGTLVAGNWLVYTQDGQGRLVYQQKVQVSNGASTVPLTLVSR